MSWKDILVIALDAETDAPALKAAVALAERFDAHLACAVLTALPDEPLAYEPTVVAGVWAELLNRARADAEDSRKAIDDALSRLGRPHELRLAEALSRDLGRIAAVHARYGDVTVIARPHGKDAAELRDQIIEGVLFHSGRPALLAPPGWTPGPIGRRIALAWDASREATRALAEARPLLESAEQVTIITVDAKPRLFGHGDQPGQNIAAHLARCGRSVEVRNVDSLGRSIADAVQAEATAVGADLLVMGAYGHSRFREMLFGGATRDLMSSGALPILMAH